MIKQVRHRFTVMRSSYSFTKNHRYVNNLKNITTLMACRHLRLKQDVMQRQLKWGSV